MSEEIKRPVGRPRNPLIDREPMRDGATKSLNMKAKPNWEINEDEEVNDSPDRKSTRLNSSHSQQSRMPSSA